MTTPAYVHISRSGVSVTLPLPPYNRRAAFFEARAEAALAPALAAALRKQAPSTDGRR